MDWFLELNTTVQGAIVTAAGTVLAAIIKGLFSMIDRGKNKTVKVVIKQKTSGNNNTFIGMQNNGREDL